MNTRQRQFNFYLRRNRFGYKIYRLTNVPVSVLYKCYGNNFGYARPTELKAETLKGGFTHPLHFSHTETPSRGHTQTISPLTAYKIFPSKLYILFELLAYFRISPT
jgi:hypothetical protein